MQSQLCITDLPIDVIIHIMSFTTVRGRVGIVQSCTYFGESQLTRLSVAEGKKIYTRTLSRRNHKEAGRESRMARRNAAIEKRAEAVLREHIRITRKYVNPLKWAKNNVAISQEPDWKYHPKLPTIIIWD